MASAASRVASLRIGPYVDSSSNADMQLFIDQIQKNEVSTDLLLYVVDKAPWVPREPGEQFRRDLVLERPPSHQDRFINKVGLYPFAPPTPWPAVWHEC